MILVTLGTQDKDFSRLLKAIDKQIENGNIKEKVIVQAGYTKYKSNNMEIFDLIEPDKLHDLVKRCNLLITHGGVGSILDGIKNGKKIIAASRLKKYKEHTNDHQRQIVKTFADKGYILELRDFSKLDKVLEKSKNFKPVKFKSNTNNFIKVIDEYITEDNHISWFNKYRQLCSYGFIGTILTIINILIFSLLYLKINLYLNIIISFSITTVLSVLLNFYKGISINNNLKKFCIIKTLYLVLDLDFMYILIHMINFNPIYSKFISGFSIMILMYILIRYVFKSDYLVKKR